MTQKELFPRNITLSPADAEILKGLLPQINLLGFDIQEFGKDIELCMEARRYTLVFSAFLSIPPSDVVGSTYSIEPNTVL